MMKSLLRITLVLSLVWCAARGAIYLLPGDPAEFLVHEALVEISPASLREKMDLPPNPVARIFSLPRNHSLIRSESALALVGRAGLRSLTLAGITLLLALPLTFLSLFFAFMGGRQGTLSRSAMLILASIPVFVLGPLLLRGLPLSNPLLPALVLALHLAAFWHRSLSRQLERALPLSPVRGARALGHTEIRVFGKSLLAPSLGGFLVFFGSQLGILLNGSLLVETLFQWHGIGNLLAESVLSRDYPVIELTLFFTALATLLVQQFGYILQGRWDPRLAQ